MNNILFGRLCVGKLFGVSICVHWSWWILLLVLLLVNPIIVVDALGAFLLLCLCEVSHSWMMRRLNVQGSSTIYLISGVSHAPLQKFLIEAKMCLAGILPNIVFVLFCLLGTDHYWINAFLRDLSLISLFFLFLQVMPYYPLVGGRAIRSVFGFSPMTAIRITQMLCVIQGAVGIYLHYYLLACVSLYLFYVAEQESHWRSDQEDKSCLNSYN